MDWKGYWLPLKPPNKMKKNKKFSPVLSINNNLVKENWSKMLDKIVNLNQKINQHKWA